MQTRVSTRRAAATAAAICPSRAAACPARVVPTSAVCSARRAPTCLLQPLPMLQLRQQLPEVLLQQLRVDLGQQCTRHVRIDAVYLGHIQAPQLPGQQLACQLQIRHLQPLQKLLRRRQHTRQFVQLTQCLLVAATTDAHDAAVLAVLQFWPKHAAADPCVCVGVCLFPAHECFLHYLLRSSTASWRSTP